MSATTPLRLPGLSIVLPAYNEAPNIVQAIHAARRAAIANAFTHEIVVVDDGSTDATAQLVGDVARTHPEVSLVVHASNRGYGAALVSGLRAALQPWVLLTDADLQFDLDELSKFVVHASDADLIVGRRAQREDPAHRRLNAAAWNRLVRSAFGVEVHDVDCAFKLINRDVIAGLPLHSDGAMISTELLVRATADGAVLRELDVTHRPRVAGRSSGANPRVVLRAFLELAALRRDLGRASRHRGAGRAVGAPVT